MASQHDPSAQHSLVVARLRDEAEGIVSVELVEEDGRELARWEPGAHIDVFAGSAGIRQYSLCGDHQDRRSYKIAVLRETAGRGGSAWIHDHVNLGDQLTIRGPRNNFQLAPAGDYVFVAGGIGITPLLTMVRAVEAAGKNWRLLYGGRSARSMAFLDELGSLGDRVQVYDESLLGPIPLASISPGADTLVYACGPEGLLSACEGLAQDWGRDRLKVERFAARDLNKRDDQEFTVVLARSGMSLGVPPGKSILEVLREQGLSTLSSCEEGLCGTCETDVLDGAVDHRDEVLDSEERECGRTMMICVSRAVGSKLTIDH